MTDHVLQRRRTVASLAALLAIAGCQSATPSGSAPGPATASAPVASESGQPSPTATGAEPTPSGEAPASNILQVVADELRMRAEAGTDAALVGTLGRGAPVRVDSGPVEADGFTWYEVTDLAGRQGWAADGDGVDAWLSSIPDLTSPAPILTLTYGCDVLGPINPPATTVLDDGHVLMTQGPAGEWSVRQLSESGLQEIRDDVFGSSHLQASAQYEPQRRADAGEPPGHGACLYTFTVPTEDEPIVVSAVGWFGDEEEAQFYVPSPERKALTAIARNLIAIGEVLGDDAWEAPAYPYIAREFAVAIGPDVDPDTLGLGDAEWSQDPAGAGDCAIISRGEAFEAARIVNEDGPSQPVRLDSAYFSPMVLVPRTPDGYPDCSDIAL